VCNTHVGRKINRATRLQTVEKTTLTRAGQSGSWTNLRPRARDFTRLRQTICTQDASSLLYGWNTHTRLNRPFPCGKRGDPSPPTGCTPKNADLHGNIDSLNPRPRVGDWRRPQSFGSSGDHLEGHSLEPGKIAWARPTSAPLLPEGLAVCPKHKTKTEKKNRLPQTKNLLTHLFWTTNLWTKSVFSREEGKVPPTSPGSMLWTCPGMAFNLFATEPRRLVPLRSSSDVS